MPCYHPLHGYYAKHVNPATGKRSWVAKLSKAVSAERLSIPCQRCIGCRLESSRQWAMRCMHQAQLHEDNSFITLTYDPEHLPYGGTLIKAHFQDFAKRLRRQIEPKRISYYHCGEYGELCRGCGENRRDCQCPQFDPRPGRPHYHALLFGHDFADKQHFKNSASGEPIFTSEALQRLWPSGFCTTGAVTFESAAYVARYCVKKINGDLAEDHYSYTDADGVIHRLLPEYTTMSLKPAIGKDWYRDYKRDVYPSDSVVMRGKEMKPPKFYDRLLELEDPAAREVLRERRKAASAKREADQTSRRLRDREQVKLAQTNQLKREL